MTLTKSRLLECFSRIRWRRFNHPHRNTGGATDRRPTSAMVCSHLWNQPCAIEAGGNEGARTGSHRVFRVPITGRARTAIPED